MAAIVHHPRLQLHLESHLVESRTLALRLPSPNQSNDSNMNKTETFQDKPNNSGWNFLDAVSNISQNTTTTYHVDPQQKRSSLVLNPKSLEMCTENLGNESGTDIVENDMLLSLMGKTEEREPCRQVLAVAKKVKIQNFPPPLTTIRGLESRREDGRLVIEFTKVPPRTSCFEAERSHGRLRLCFLTNETSFDWEEDSEIDIDDGVIDENEPPRNEEIFSENEMIGEETNDAEKKD